MRTRAIAVLVLWSAPLTAEVLDQVAAAAGQQVVTLSAIRRHLRILALTEGKPLQDTPEARRRAAERLIDQAMVLREIQLSRYSVPTMAEAEASIQQFIESRKETPEQFAAALKSYGFTDDEFRQEVLWRNSVARFVEFRFAPGIQVSDEEIEAYYQKEFVPIFRATNPGVADPVLDEVRERITRVVSVRKTNVALDQWLVQMRETLKVRYFEAAFRDAENATP
jgi:parvulin-like peptidyl-prolyl isomerase